MAVERFVHTTSHDQRSSVQTHPFSQSGSTQSGRTATRDQRSEFAASSEETSPGLDKAALTQRVLKPDTTAPLRGLGRSVPDALSQQLATLKDDVAQLKALAKYDYVDARTGTLKASDKEAAYLAKVLTSPASKSVELTLKKAQDVLNFPANSRSQRQAAEELLTEGLGTLTRFPESLAFAKEELASTLIQTLKTADADEEAARRGDGLLGTRVKYEALHDRLLGQREGASNLSLDNFLSGDDMKTLRALSTWLIPVYEAQIEANTLILDLENSKPAAKPAATGTNASVSPISIQSKASEHSQGNLRAQKAAKQHSILLRTLAVTGGLAALGGLVAGLVLLIQRSKEDEAAEE